MNSLIELILAVAEARTGRPGPSFAGRIAGAAVIGAVALGCTVGTLICLLTALWVYLRPLVGPVAAPLIVAGVLSLLGLALTLVARRLLVRPGDPPVPAPIASNVAAELGQMVKDDKTAWLVAALLAGFRAGNRKR
jgi:hypothetical protein